MKYISTILLGLSFAIFSCENNANTDKVKQTVDNAADKVEEAVDNTVHKAKEKLDENFVTNVLKDNAEELEWLRAGTKLGTDQELIEIAKKMIPDHEKLGSDFRNYASKKNITIDVDTTEGVKIDSKTGQKWDAAWADKIKTMHREMIGSFEKQQSNAEDAELKELVTNTLPTLRSHLNDTERLETKVSKVSAKK